MVPQHVKVLLLAVFLTSAKRVSVDLQDDAFALGLENFNQSKSGGSPKYAAALLYAAATAAAKQGVKNLIFNPKKSVRSMFTKEEARGAIALPDGSWSQAVLTNMAAEGPPCILMFDMGGGKLAGTMYSKSGTEEYKELKQAGRWASTDHPTLVVGGPGQLNAAEIYDSSSKNTFEDYSDKPTAELEKWAAVLAKHISTAYDSMKTKCSGETIVFARQTGKIRFKVKVEQAQKEWPFIMKAALTAAIVGTVDYDLLSSEDEAALEGEDFWGGQFESLVDLLGGKQSWDGTPLRLTPQNTMLVQVGSSSTQGSSVLPPHGLQAGGDGLLGAKPTNAQVRQMEDNTFDYDFVGQMEKVLLDAGVGSLQQEKTVLLLNAISYSFNDMVDWGYAPELAKTVKAGNAINPCVLRVKAAEMMGMDKGSEKPAGC